MTTVRQLERLWTGHNYPAVLEQTFAMRPEGALQRELLRDATASASAAALLRLQELHQQHTPLAGRLVRTLIHLQQPDGGWGDVAVTALALRALMNDRGFGEAVERGLAYLAALQKHDDPIWPDPPVGRMPADALKSAFVLHQLGSFEAFRAAVRFDDAVRWFEANESELDAPTSRLWQRAKQRIGGTVVRSPQLELVWS